MSSFLPPNSESFRRTLGRFATGVTVIGARTADGPRATTASAFTSLSLEPPLVLVCLKHTSRILTMIRSSREFSVSILSSQQQDVALALSRSERGDDPMTGIEWFTIGDEIPMISGAIAHLHCRLHEDSDGGDHAIVIGEVASLDVHPGSPLVYADGSFGALEG